MALLSVSAPAIGGFDYHERSAKLRRAYVLGILTATYAFNMVDRSLLNILQGPIRAEFNLSDTQLGLLTGVAFSAFYSISSLFIAGLADIGVRRTVLSLAITGWSLSTAACGFVGGFGTLFMSRVGVGVCESGSVPTSQSMIADMYPVEARGSAVGVTNCGIFIGQFIGLAVGAWLGSRVGWRSTFIAIGLIGVAFALMVRLTVAEPVRRQARTEDSQTLWRLLASLGKSPVFRNLMIGCALPSMSGVGSFMPLFMMRSHGLTLGQVGFWLGLVSGIGGALGTMISGRATDLLARGGSLYRLPLAPAVMLAVAAPALFVALHVSSPILMMAAYFLPALTVAAHIPPAIIVTHSLVPPQSRARASALVMLLLNLVGASLSTLAIGMLSDYLRPRMGVPALGTAMTAVFLCATAGAIVFLYRASRLMRRAETSAA